MVARHPPASGSWLRCALATCGLALLLAPAGCTRTRPVTPTPAAGNPIASSATVDPAATAANSSGVDSSAAESSAADSSATVPTAAPAIVEVTAPTDGASVAAPIPVGGTALLESGRQLAAQVFSQGSDGSRAWRGNGLLTVQDDGRFEGTIAYTLDVAGPGVVEIAVVDATSGAVSERRSIPVQLAAAP